MTPKCQEERNKHKFFESKLIWFMSVTKSNWQFKTFSMWKLLRTDEFALSCFLDFVTCTVINQMFIRRQFHADYDYILWWICPDKLATINTHAIWYNWIRIWQSNLKPIGFHSSLFCTRTVLLLLPFLTYRTFTVSSVVEFDAL